MFRLVAKIQFTKSILMETEWLLCCHKSHNMQKWFEIFSGGSSESHLESCLHCEATVGTASDTPIGSDSLLQDHQTRAPLEAWTWNIIGQTEAAEHSSAWTGEEPHWLVSAWGETVAPFKLSSIYGDKCRCLSQRYDVTHFMLEDALLQHTCYSNLPVGSIMLPSLNKTTSQSDTC